MNKIVQLITFLILINPFCSFAEETNIIDKDLDNLSGHYAECAAYYRLVYYALISSNKEDAANSYRKIEDNAMLYSLILASEGRSEDLAVNVSNSRIEMYMKQMKIEADNRNENVSILINKYNFTCQGLMNNPSGALTKILSNKINVEKN